MPLLLMMLKEGACNQFDTLSLSSYPRENITDFTSEAQSLIKIMQGNYALPVNTGSNLIQKVTKTSSEYFNHKMYAILDKVKTLEHEYKLADPKTLTKDAKYPQYGPLGIIATLQAAHGSLLSELDWPALANKLSEANATPNVDNATTTLTTHTCFHCGRDHMICDCPQPATASNCTSTALAAWKHIKPADSTIIKTDDLGRVWRFCTKCKC